MKTRIFYLYLQEMLSFCFPVHKHRKRPKTIKESKNIFHNTNHFIGVIFDEKLVLWANVGLLTTKNKNILPVYITIRSKLISHTFYA